MTTRRRFRHTTTLGERLAQHAEKLRAKAKALPRLEREQAMKKIRQLDVAQNITEWLSSPGLQPPK